MSLSAPLAPVTPAVSRERARAAGELLRIRRARQFRPTAYQAYCALLGVAIYGALVAKGISTAIGPGPSGRTIAIWGPGIVVVVLLSVLRSGTWQGPVVFSRGDVAFLLAAPIALADLVRPKLAQACVAALGLGGMTGFLVVLCSHAGPGGIGAARCLGSIVAFAALGVLAVACTWLVERSFTVSRWLLRISPLTVVAAVGLVAVAGAGSVERKVTIWTGPWGWALAPLAGTHGWGLAVGLSVAGAAAAVALALARSGRAPTERFLAQAETRSQIAASATNMDYRAATLARRAATSSGRRRSLRRLRRPRAARYALVWRDAVALLRMPSRFVTAAVLGAAGTLEAIGHPGRPLPAGIAAILLYFAAGALAEPLRTDIDDPERSWLMLSWDYGRVLVAHCVVPWVGLWLISGVTVAVAVAAGFASTGPALLGVIPTVIVTVTGVAVLSAALGARSGGRIGQSVILRILSSAATDPMGGASAVLWVAPWLLLEIVLVALPVLILGHAVEHHRPAAGVAGTAIVFSGSFAYVLRSVVSRSKPSN